MKILSLLVMQPGILFPENYINKEYNFNDNTLIYSSTNSQGKTTLIRAILYALGYNIPATRGINFSKFEFSIEIITDKKTKYTLIRNDKIIKLIQEDKLPEYYNLPDMTNDLHARIFLVENLNILSNLLGCFYFDQEKGWNLLNRGIIIGSLRFSIENLLLGLVNKNCDDLNHKINTLEKTKKRYETMFDIYKYKKEIVEKNDEINLMSEFDELYNKINILELSKSPLETSLKKISDALAKNNSFIEYIDEMKIRIKTNCKKETEILVSKNNILDFNKGQHYLKIKHRLINEEINKINFEVMTIQDQIKIKRESLNIEIESLADTFDNQIEKIHVDQHEIKTIIQRIKSQLEAARKEKRDFIKQNNSALKYIFSYARDFAKIFKLEEKFFKSGEKEILTHDLKTLTGAKFSQLIFCYKMSYIKVISDLLNIKLPIIIDSPHSKEIDKNNITKMMKIIEENFSEHQIIIASIFNKKEYNIDLHTITVNGNVIENNYN